MIRNRSVYDLIFRFGALAQKLIPQTNGMIRRLPPPMNGWTRGRDIRPLAKESFIRRWKKI
jgi:L-lactate dehydrogenase complex protein LldF